MNKQKIILSLGGSIIVPEEVDVEFIKKFKALILKFLSQYQFFIITGGGKICRKYQKAAAVVSKVSNEDLDWIGIHTSRFNAQLMYRIFKPYSYPEIITDPNVSKALKSPIIWGAGWKPGWSTDYDAVTLAIQQKVKTVVNLSNIEYIYNKDPKKFKNAEKQEQINWKDFRKLVGNKWRPGLNMPFDPIAAKLAQKHQLKVVVLQGTNLNNFKNFLEGKKFKGTTISN